MAVSVKDLAVGTRITMKKETYYQSYENHMELSSRDAIIIEILTEFKKKS